MNSSCRNKPKIKIQLQESHTMYDPIKINQVLSDYKLQISNILIFTFMTIIIQKYIIYMKQCDTFKSEYFIDVSTFINNIDIINNIYDRFIILFNKSTFYKVFINHFHIIIGNDKVNYFSVRKSRENINIPSFTIVYLPNIIINNYVQLLNNLNSIHIIDITDAFIDNLSNCIDFKNMFTQKDCKYNVRSLSLIDLTNLQYYCKKIIDYIKKYNYLQKNNENKRYRINESNRIPRTISPPTVIDLFLTPENISMPLFTCNSSIPEYGTITTPIINSSITENISMPLFTYNPSIPEYGTITTPIIKTRAFGPSKKPVQVCLQKKLTFIDTPPINSNIQNKLNNISDLLLPDSVILDNLFEKKYKRKYKRKYNSEKSNNICNYDIAYINNGNIKLGILISSFDYSEADICQQIKLDTYSIYVNYPNMATNNIFHLNLINKHTDDSIVKYSIVDESRQISLDSLINNYSIHKSFNINIEFDLPLYNMIYNLSKKCKITYLKKYIKNKSVEYLIKYCRDTQYLRDQLYIILKNYDTNYYENILKLY